MATNEINSNAVKISGEIVSGFTYSYSKYGNDYYRVNLATSRLSGRLDYIPLMVSGQLISTQEDYRGYRVEVVGQLRSYNRHIKDRTHLELSVFVNKINFIEDEYTDNNEIFLDGYICKAPQYRTTPLGREITDLILAVNRSNRESDYIPCIAWGKFARYISRFEVGAPVSIKGRIQSREYTKKLSETEYEKRVAYEVSINRLENGQK